VIPGCTDVTWITSVDDLCWGLGLWTTGRREIVHAQAYVSSGDEATRYRTAYGCSYTGLVLGDGLENIEAEIPLFAVRVEIGPQKITNLRGTNGRRF
jgi:hypothetical protein